MRMKNVIIVVLLTVISLLMLGYQREVAAARRDFKPAKIGVISLRRVVENNQKQIQWAEEMEQKRQSMLDELRKMAEALEAKQADMKTRKPESADYMDLAREIAREDAIFKRMKEFYELDLATQEKRWHEKMFQDILAITKRVAEENNLDIVLAKEEYNFPTKDTNELALVMKTSKVLFHSEELDITNTVLEALDMSK